MIIYELLTWLIILLSKLRKWYLKRIYRGIGFYVRRDRDNKNKIEKGQVYLKYQGFSLECCDCGLTHTLQNWENSEDLHCIPERPKDYQYKLRAGW